MSRVRDIVDFHFNSIDISNKPQVHFNAHTMTTTDLAATGTITGINLADLADVSNVTASNDGHYLYYNHSTTNFQWQAGAGGGAALAFSNIAVAGQTQIIADGNADTLNIAAGSGMTITTTPGSDTITFASTSSYANGDVDTHLNQSNPTNGYVLSWNGSDYTWVAQSGSYANGDVDTHLNQSNPTGGYVLSWNGSDYAWVAQSGGGGGADLYSAETTGSINPTASGTLSLAIGSSASATGIWATAVGKSTTASANFSAAFGNGAKSTGNNSIALGASVSAGTRSFAVVIDDTSGTYGAKGQGSIAMGKQATASGDNSVAIGKDATATANQIALGDNTATVKIAGLLTVDDNLTVSGTITSSQAGAPILTSTSSITLRAATNSRVHISQSPLRLYNVSTTNRNAISAADGDMIYNTTTNKAQVFANGSWADLH